MVELLLCGVYLLEEVADASDVSDNSASTLGVEEATYPFSCVIVIFAANFPSFALLIWLQ